MPDCAYRAWAERMAVRLLGGAHYANESASGATHVDHPIAVPPTGPDATSHGETCKHQRRVTSEITTRRVFRRATCAPCGTERFLGETQRPPALCGKCRLDRGDVARGRETDDCLLVVAVRDQRARATRVEDGDTTVAE